MKRLIFLLLTLVSIAATAQHLGIKLGNTQQLKIFGFAQGHFDYQNTDGVERNDFNFKHVVLIADGSITDKLSFRLMTDFVSPDIYLLLQEYYAQYDFAPWLKLRVGQFKQPYTIENIMIPTLIGALSSNESVRYLAGIVGDPLYGLMAGRDQGVMLTGDLLPAADGHNWLGYSIGIFNGAGVNQRDNNNAKDVIAMLNFNPWKEVQLSASMQIGQGTARNASPFSGIMAGEKYTRNRWSVGLKAHYGRVMLRSEWMAGQDGHTPLHGGYAELWITTLPKLDIVLDIDHVNRNTDLSRAEQELLPSATQNTNYTAGLQYWFHRQCRIATHYTYTDRPTAPATHLWATQLQLMF